MNNDYELVYLAKENDEIAIDLLYKKYYKLIYHMVKSMLLLILKMKMYF